MSSNCECTKQTDVDSAGGLSAVQALNVHTHTLSLDLNGAQQLGYTQSEGVFNKTAH